VNIGIIILGFQIEPSGTKKNMDHNRKFGKKITKYFSKFINYNYF
jgi:hypothetical protein